MLRESDKKPGWSLNTRSGHKQDVIGSFNEAKFNNFIKTILTCSSPEQVKNTTHAVPRFRGAHVSQSGAPKGDPHRFQCYNTGVLFSFETVEDVNLVKENMQAFFFVNT